MHFLPPKWMYTYHCCCIKKNRNHCSFNTLNMRTGDHFEPEGGAFPCRSQLGQAYNLCSGPALASSSPSPARGHSVQTGARDGDGDRAHPLPPQLLSVCLGVALAKTTSPPLAWLPFTNEFAHHGGFPPHALRLSTPTSGTCIIFWLLTLFLENLQKNPSTTKKRWSPHILCFQWDSNTTTLLCSQSACHFD